VRPVVLFAIGLFCAQKYFSKTLTEVWQFCESHRFSGERGNHHPPLAKREGVNM